MAKNEESKMKLMLLSIFGINLFIVIETIDINTVQGLSMYTPLFCGVLFLAGALIFKE